MPRRRPARRRRHRRRHRRAAPRRTRHPPRRRCARAAGPGSTRGSRARGRCGLPPPETRPSVGADAQLAEQVEDLAQPMGDAFEHGAHERAAVVTQREPGERAARSPGRRAVPARRRGRAGTGDPRRRAARPPPRRRARRTARPARSCRAATAAIRRPRASRPSGATSPATAWQAAWRRPRSSAANAGSAPKTTPEVPRTMETAPPGLHDADAERPGRLIPGAGRDGDAVACVAADRGGLERRRHATPPGCRARSSTASLQRRRATSNSSVPDASVTSVACSPVRRSRTKSLGSITPAMRVVGRRAPRRAARAASAP